MNEKITVTHRSVSDRQLAFPNRTQFVPGKVGGDPTEANWGTEFKVPTGNPIADDNGGMVYTRVALLGRGSVCDQTIPTPVLVETHVYSNPGASPV
jgi:hypothetical protein